MRHRCPTCGSARIRRSHHKMVGGQIALVRTPYRCRKCGMLFWAVSSRTWSRVAVYSLLFLIAIAVLPVWRMFDQFAERVDVAEKLEASRHRDGLADYRAALKLLEGEGVASHLAEGMALMERSAQDGYPAAQYRLGLLLRDGIGVSADEQRALTWLRVAADGGEPHAQLEVGRMYRDGRGASPDPARAVAWLSLSAANGIDVAAQERDRLLAGMSEGDANVARAEARHLIATRVRGAPGEF